MRHHDAVFGLEIVIGVVLVTAIGGRVLGGPADGNPNQATAGAAPVAVILDQPDLPRLGAPSDPNRLAAILRQAGWDCRLFSASDLANQASLDAAGPSLIVLPYGPVFPIEARDPLLAFLERGGSLITTGGYAFNEQVRRVDGRWVRRRVEAGRAPPGCHGEGALAAA